MIARSTFEVVCVYKTEIKLFLLLKSLITCLLLTATPDPIERYAIVDDKVIHYSNVLHILFIIIFNQLYS